MANNNHMSNNYQVFMKKASVFHELRRKMFITFY